MSQLMKLFLHSRYLPKGQLTANDLGAHAMWQAEKRQARNAQQQATLSSQAVDGSLSQILLDMDKLQSVLEARMGLRHGAPDLPEQVVQRIAELLDTLVSGQRAETAAKKSSSRMVAYTRIEQNSNIPHEMHPRAWDIYTGRLRPCKGDPK